MPMEYIYATGPTAVGLSAALMIAGYCWKRWRSAGLVLLVWISVAVAVGQYPFFAGLPTWQPTDWRGFLLFGTLAFTPAVLLLIAAVRVPRFRQALRRMPTSALVLTQASRCGGVFLLLAYLRGDLPAAIGLVSGLLDVIVASSAVLLSGYLRADEARASRLVPAWAILGLIDFGWAVVMMVASFLGVLNLTPAPVMLGNPPLLIISLFVLPFGIFINGYLLLRVRDGAATRPQL
jgi:hypothetical protein